MKKYFIILLILFQSCSYLAVNPPKKNSSGPFDNPLLLLGLLNVINSSSCGKNGNFWVRNITNNSSYCVNSKLVGSATGADFYVQTGLETGIDFSVIVNEYNSKISPTLDSTFGKASDVNKDGKIIILTVDILDGGSSSRGFVAGFVDPVNFTEDLQFAKLRSNQMEILYMDGNELATKRKKSLEAGEKDPYLATVAHELQHLIRFPYSLGGDATWIDEGTAEIASDLSGYGPQSDRIICFKGSACSSLGVQGSSPFSWRSTLENYSYSYALMRYLYLASGSTDAKRKEFLSNTVIGKNNYRGNDALGLMEIFKLSDKYVNKTTSSIPTDSSTLFRYLLTYFMGRSQGYTNFSSTNVTILGVATSLADVNTDFPLTYSTDSFSLPSGTTSLVFVNKITSSVTLTPGSVVLKDLPISTSSGAFVKDSSTYIALNPNPSGSSISAGQISSYEEPVTLHEGANCITSNYFFQESRTRSNVRRYLFDKP
jgi:hypothetical protein